MISILNGTARETRTQLASPPKTIAAIDRPNIGLLHCVSPTEFLCDTEHCRVVSSVSLASVQHRYPRQRGRRAQPQRAFPVAGSAFPPRSLGAASLQNGLSRRDRVYRCCSVIPAGLHCVRSGTSKQTRPPPPCRFAGSYLWLLVLERCLSPAGLQPTGRSQPSWNTDLLLPRSSGVIAHKSTIL